MIDAFIFCHSGVEKKDKFFIFPNIDQNNSRNEELNDFLEHEINQSKVITNTYYLFLRFVYASRTHLMSLFGNVDVM